RSVAISRIRCTSCSTVSRSVSRSPSTAMACRERHLSPYILLSTHTKSSESGGVFDNTCSLRRRLEISQIRRRLALLGRHQQAVGAQHIALMADHDVIVLLGAIDLAPERPRLGVASIGFEHGPRAGESMVDYGDLIEHEVAIALIGKNPLLD